MFANPASQAFFPGPGADDALLTVSCYAQDYSLFDEPFLANQAFIDGNAHQAPKPHEQEQRSSLVDDSDWRDANACAAAAAAAAQHLPATGYGQQHELGAASWGGSQLHAPTLTELAGVDYADLYALPQGVYSQFQAMTPTAAFELALSPASSGWAPAGSSPHGILGGDSPAPMQQAAPFFPLDEGFAHFTYEPQPLESQAKGLFPGAMDSSYVLPQAVYQPAPPVPSAASTPSFGGLSSGASLADVSDVSDTNAASPARWSSSGASEPAASPASAAAASPAKGRETTPARGKAPNTRSRATRRRTRLPSVPPGAPSPASTVSGRTRSSAKKQGRARPTATRAPVTPGAPYRRIQDMDPASRAQLDRLLVAFRARGTPYKVIMDRLRHIYLGNHNTLRGRLRTLTLAPPMRVRNPVWEDSHIELLKEAVAHEGCRHPNTRKTSWTRVSDYIHDRTGPGSYKFSVTACSRKWQDLAGGEEGAE